jgi:SulP family sulfate permease
MHSTLTLRVPTWLARLAPFLTWIPRVNRETARDDIAAGLTGAVVVLPQGVAFATIAGMPPEYGLYAGMVPAVIAALFGSSWHLVSGPTTAASIVLFSALSAFAEPGSVDYVRLALTLTFMVGVIELVLGIARLGTLVNFISHAVVVGFTAGAALLIAGNQIKHFLGIEMARGLSFHEILVQTARHYDQMSIAVAAVGAVTLAAGMASRRFFPKVPYMIVAMVVGSVVAAVMNVALGGAETIPTVGALPASLPPLSAPDFSLKTLRDLAPAAFAVTLFALTEAVSISRSLAVRSGQYIDGNQEFIGQGLSNLAGSFFSGYVATGSFNRSGVNFQAGAKTPLAAVFAGLLLICIVLLVAPYAAYLPNAAMAAILFLVAWGLIDLHHIKKIIATSRSETVVLTITFFATLLLDLEFAIFLGVMASLVSYLYRTSRPQVLARVPDPQLPNRKFNTTSAALPECPQLKIVRVDGSLFFGAVNPVREALQRFEAERPEQKHLALVAHGINFIDVAGAEFLAQEAARRRQRGGGLYLIRPKEGLCAPMRSGGYLDEIGRENVFHAKSEAIATILRRLDPEVCGSCRHRIFLECPGRGTKVGDP